MEEGQLRYKKIEGNTGLGFCNEADPSKNIKKQ